MLLQAVISANGLSKDYDVEVISKKTRSRNANNYYWVLNGKIAEKLHTSKDELHVEMLKRYGQTAYVFSVKSEIDVTKFTPYVDIIGRTTLNEVPFTHYRALKGSSDFDTEEMAVFLDGVVQEAKDLGIETITPAELEKMKENWKQITPN
jgi:hypothetical protein